MSRKPMRLSSVRGDVGFNEAASRWAVVFVDGARLPNCFTADEIRGEAFAYVLDARGNAIVGMTDDVTFYPDALLTERYTGKVEIRFHIPDVHPLMERRQ